MLQLTRLVIPCACALLSSQVDHVWVKGLKQQPATPPSTTSSSSSSTDATSTLTAAAGAAAAAAASAASTSTVTSPRVASPCHSLSVGAATLMPDDVDDRSWCKAFALSDHRPLQVRINFNDSTDGSTDVSSDDDVTTSAADTSSKQQQQQQRQQQQQQQQQQHYH
jgi:hypothetical protein